MLVGVLHSYGTARVGLLHEQGTSQEPSLPPVQAVLSPTGPSPVGSEHSEQRGGRVRATDTASNETGPGSFQPSQGQQQIWQETG